MRGHNYKTYQTDLLIIGAGGAGVRAAIEAKRQGENVLLLGKEVLGCSHTGMAMGGLNAAIVAPATPEFHLDISNEGGYYINNEKVTKVFCDEMPDRIRDLEKYGVIFDRREDGEFAVWAGPKQVHPLNLCVGDYTGREMMQGLVDEARKLQVDYSDEFFITKLLKNNNKACGAIGIDIKTGEVIVFEAKAIIVATGGAGRMYEVTTNAASNTGDGYAMAFDLGVELVDMEMTQFHPTGMAFPQSQRGVLIAEKTRGIGGILRNNKGERFMEKYFPKEKEMAKRDQVSRSIYTEVAEGRGTKNHAVYLSVSHLKPEVIKDQIPDVYEQYKNVGVDITKEPMEIYPSMHHMMGGIKINEWTETSVDGLFACGEVTGGVHGANRLGGNSIAEGQVFGRRAGIRAGEYIKNTDFEKLPQEEIDSEISRLDTFLNAKNGIPPHEIEDKLKKVMWNKVGIFRDEAGLTEAKKIVAELYAALPTMKARTSGTIRNRDLQDCFEVVNMVKTARLVIDAALFRKESRGAHSRTDFPDTLAEWKKNVIVSQGQDAEDIKVETREVVTYEN